MKKKITTVILCAVLFLTLGFMPVVKRYIAGQSPLFKLIVLSPAHPHGVHTQQAFSHLFHKEVSVYAASKADMQTSYLDYIERFNKKSKEQDAWRLHVYTGADYLERMLQDKKGDIALIASNNQLKSTYILKTAKAGINILADKPMALTASDFDMLENAFQVAERQGNYISDLPSMSMRRFVPYILQKELIATPEVFGVLVKGTAENPAVIQKNNHLYWKGSKRPAWFFDVKQQGNGLTDVTTHLVDIVQWSCFPETPIDYRKDIHITSAKTWATEITPAQFKKATAMDAYPDYLNEYAKDSVLQIHSNGEIDYTLKGTHVQIISTWGFESIAGEKDSYESIIRGSKATLRIEAGNRADVFIEPNGGDLTGMEEALQANFTRIKMKYPYLSLSREKKGWRISSEKNQIDGEKEIVPPSRWECHNMLAKYYTTTQAYQIAEMTKK